MSDRWRFTSVVDLGEKLLFTAIFGYFFLEFSRAFYRDPHIVTALYLADQTMIMLFLLFRRHAQLISRDPLDYGTGAAGTLLPLLATPVSGQSVAPITVCVLLMLLGILIHLGAKLSLRRSFGIVAADRGIKVEGPYRFIRHPMYLGYMIVHVSLLLAGPTAWNVIVFGTTWVMFVLRIRGEERLLGQNETYRAFQAKTRFRLIPGLY